MESKQVSVLLVKNILNKTGMRKAIYIVQVETRYLGKTQMK